jgi:hypothetical protein
MGTGGLFPGGKSRPGRDAEHSLQSSAEVKSEDYMPSPPWSLNGVAGQLYLLLMSNHTKHRAKEGKMKRIQSVFLAKWISSKRVRTSLANRPGLAGTVSELNPYPESRMGHIRDVNVPEPREQSHRQIYRFHPTVCKPMYLQWRGMAWTLRNETCQLYASNVVRVSCSFCLCKNIWRVKINKTSVFFTLNNEQTDDKLWSEYFKKTKLRASYRKLFLSWYLFQRAMNTPIKSLVIWTVYGARNGKECLLTSWKQNYKSGGI